MSQAVTDLAVQQIAAMAVAAINNPLLSDVAEQAGEKQFVVIPEGHTLAEIPMNAKRPFRSTGKVVVDDIASLKEMCARFAHPESSVIYVRSTIGEKSGFTLSTTAVFNDHEKDEFQPLPAYRDHCCVFQARNTPAWEAWQKANGRYMSQEEFATFLEDQLLDIFAPHDDETAPTGVQILELARNLEINKQAKFRSSIRTTSGALELELTETESDATKSRIQIFERFFIAVRPFYGAAPWTFEARIRFRTDSETKSVKFKVDLVRADRVLETVVAEYIEDLKNTGLPVISGTAF